MPYGVNWVPAEQVWITIDMQDSRKQILCNASSSTLINTVETGEIIFHSLYNECLSVHKTTLPLTI